MSIAPAGCLLGQKIHHSSAPCDPELQKLVDVSMASTSHTVKLPSETCSADAATSCRSRTSADDQVVIRQLAGGWLHRVPGYGLVQLQCSGSIELHMVGMHSFDASLHKGGQAGYVLHTHMQYQLRMLPLAASCHLHLHLHLHLHAPAAQHIAAADESHAFLTRQAGQLFSQRPRPPSRQSVQQVTGMLRACQTGLKATPVLHHQAVPTHL